MLAERLFISVVSTQPCVTCDDGQTYGGGHHLQSITADKTVVALAAQVPVKVSRENGSIAIGDPLSSASAPAESFNFFILISVIVLIGFASMVLMQRKQTGGAYMKRLIFLVPLVLALLVGVSISTAQSAPAATYEINWYTIDGGGALNVSGGSYSLSGTIGQPDAGALSGGAYTLAGGFWGGAVANYNVYLPLLLKNS